MKVKTGAVEFFGDLHGAEGLAVAFGVGRAELAGYALLDGAALEIGDDHDGLAVEAGHAGGHRGIVGELTIAVDLAEVGEEGFDVVHRIRTLGVSGQFGFDPGFGNGWCGLGACSWDVCSAISLTNLIVREVWGGGLGSGAVAEEFGPG